MAAIPGDDKKRKKEAQHLLMRARRLMSRHTFKLSPIPQEQEMFRLTQDRLVNGHMPATLEETVDLLQSVYLRFSECEFSYDQFRDFSEWGRESRAVLRLDIDPEQEWFNKPVRPTLLEMIQYLAEDNGGKLLTGGCLLLILILLALAFLALKVLVG